MTLAGSRATPGRRLNRTAARSSSAEVGAFRGHASSGEANAQKDSSQANSSYPRREVLWVARHTEPLRSPLPTAAAWRGLTEAPAGICACWPRGPEQQEISRRPSIPARIHVSSLLRAFRDLLRRRSLTTGECRALLG